jgi:hypothetical protein
MINVYFCSKSVIEQFPFFSTPYAANGFCREKNVFHEYTFLRVRKRLLSEIN